MLFNLEGAMVESSVVSFTTSALNDVIDSDGDGITDVWEIINNLDPQNGLDAAEDSDNDGLTNLEEFEANTNPFDPDSDNDGMPDGWEVDRDLDPNDASDADADRNGDGESNLDEFLNAVDTTSPVISLPQEATIDATGLLTPVTGTGVSVTDDLDTQVDVFIVGGELKPSGQHLIYWQAQDNAGNRTIASQIVNINPMVLVRERQYVAEGNQVSLEVMLSGEAPSYPVSLDVGYSGSANASDYDLAPTSITIEEGITGSIDLDIVEDGVTEGEETLSVDLSNFVNSAAGNITSHQIVIAEGNLPARVALSSMQDGELATTVVRDGSNVVVSVEINDPNADDTHTVNWSGTDSGIIDLDSDPLTLTFNPTSLTQRVYEVSATVSDSGSPIENSTAKLSLKVLDSAPVLLDGVDSDGDGISDTDEGYQDSDGDGVPDYLDSSDESHLIQLVENISNQDGTFWMETEAGLNISLGNVALNSGAGVASVEEDDLANVSPYNGFGSDEGFGLVADMFDFIITGLARPGDSVSVVIPQVSAIPAEAVYRKLHPVNGWQTYVENNSNAIYSAPGIEGACPSPGDDSYTAGLTQGHWCVMLVIEDGGPNDGDQLVDGSILDPGGLAILNEAPTVSIPAISQLEEGQTISLRATVNDNGNQIVSYQWAQISGPAVTINNANQINASVANAPDGTFEFSLTIVDQHGRSVSANVSVTVTAKAVEPPPPPAESSSGGGSLPAGVIWMLVVIGWWFRKKK